MQAWMIGVLVTAGMSTGLGLGCGGGGSPALGSDAGTATTPDLTFRGPSVCASGQSWSGGGNDDDEHERKKQDDDEGSPDMLPGRACIACHAWNEAPTFSIAGTVFPRGHVPDDCLPTVAEATDLAHATVVITDVNDQVLTLALTSTGNFARIDEGYGAVAFPVTARVVYQGKERPMLTPQRSGDCNGCHTDRGESGAPGRITLP